MDSMWSGFHNIINAGARLTYCSFAAAALFVFPDTAWACSCRTIEPDYQHVDVLFTGTVESVHVPWLLETSGRALPHALWWRLGAASNPNVVMQIRVDEIWRGVSHQSELISFGSGLCCDCSSDSHMSRGISF